MQGETSIWTKRQGATFFGNTLDVPTMSYENDSAMIVTSGRLPAIPIGTQQSAQLEPPLHGSNRKSSDGWLVLEVIRTWFSTMTPISRLAALWTEVMIVLGLALMP
jgi:hypothetical protein